MVNYAKLGNGIAAVLRGNCVGFEIAVYNGLDLEWSDGGGESVIAPPTAMTSRSRMGVMSMSKTLTAAAVVHRIAAMIDSGEDISIDSKIAPFLPSRWQHGPHVDQMTFRHLLTHTSGLTEVGDPPDKDPDVYANLEKTIAQGSTGLLTEPSYANANYCLFRIILPYLHLGHQFFDFIENGPSGSSLMPTLTGADYVSYVITHVLTPSLIDGVSVTPSGPTPYTLWYKTTDTSQHWQDGPNGDALLRTGAGYWNMSAREFGSFIAHLRHGSIISKSHWKWMYENPIGTPSPGRAPAGLGLWVFQGGKHGTYYGHNGGFEAWTNGPGAYGGWMAYPDGTTAVFLVNSDNIIGKEPEFDILMPAYDAAS